MRTEADMRIELHARDATFRDYSQQLNVLCRDKEFVVVIEFVVVVVVEDVLEPLEDVFTYIQHHRITLQVKKALLALHPTNGCDIMRHFVCIRA